MSQIILSYLDGRYLISNDIILIKISISIIKCIHCYYIIHFHEVSKRIQMMWMMWMMIDESS